MSMSLYDEPNHGLRADPRAPFLPRVILRWGTKKEVVVQNGWGVGVGVPWMTDGCTTPRARLHDNKDSRPMYSQEEDNSVCRRLMMTIQLIYGDLLSYHRFTFVFFLKTYVQGLYMYNRRHLCHSELSTRWGGGGGTLVTRCREERRSPQSRAV